MKRIANPNTWDVTNVQIIVKDRVWEFSIYRSNVTDLQIIPVVFK
jgi:hypothetical protein